MAAPSLTIINGTRSGETLTATSSDQKLYGLAGDDLLDREDGLTGLGLFGGDGNDILVGTARDTLDGGAGIDTVQFGASVSGLTDKMLLNVERIEITNDDSEGGSYNFSSQKEALEIIGSDFADTITGGAGKDVIRGGDGADSLLGGAGNDSIHADGGDDYIDGGTGTDTVYFYADLAGDDLTDLQFKNVEKVEIVDDVESPVGILLNLSLQTELLQITGDDGNDTIHGGFRADTITGGLGEDVLYGNDGADLIVADGGDSVDGGLGDDTVRYADGVDLLADDALINIERIVITNSRHGSYDFSAQGGDGSVWEALNITGGTGNDTIYGGQDADTIVGGNGNDWLLVQDTDARIDGGVGTDTAEFVTEVSTSNLADADLIGVERVVLSYGEDGEYDFSVQSEALNITGSAYQDSVTGGKGADSINGGDGDDSLVGSLGNDSLSGGAGDDILIGGAGVDWLRGGDGADLLVAEDTDGLIDGGSNASTGVYVEYDTVQFAKGVSSANLRDVDMVGIEVVEITSAATGRYDFSVQSEALIIRGGEAADTIIGGKDWDWISGGAGVDDLKGGLGADRFDFSSADAADLDLDTAAGLVTDIIRDFSGQGGQGDTITGLWGAADTNYAEGEVWGTLTALLDDASAMLDGTIQYYLGQYNGDSYLVTDYDGSGYTEVIRLVGVKLDGIQAADIVANAVT